ncbi:MAG TPA: ribonucleoside triphosphate reductase [Firmicutes bacterium]|uniref:Ribonucleoside triphosphate reductase n=1 Tax=candidate division TA06 bacterium TaxID=2250710 RepID=A0A660S8F9_UNCT6|nr:MAG: ribonucleoside triphosphate reductase [candidate division TA06 bacterium]HFD04582.1 ribonucleoside triphosphate reductase [Bacillota bacterium]
MTNTIEFIRKRDGRLVPFEPEKIYNAIVKAVKSVGGTDFEKARRITSLVVASLNAIYKGDNIPTVENVQDLVEKILIEEGHAKTAKAYILYREQHNKLRDVQELFSESVKIVDEYLLKKDWRVNENSNMSYSLQGLNNHITSAISARYWLKRIYPDYIGDAHTDGDLHIHDLGLLSVYCCGWDLQDILNVGFTGAVGKVESRPAKHFRTALGQIVNFFYTLQGEAAGAQAFSNFDTLLAPFIHYDNLDYKQVKQAMQEFLFNLNVPTRVGFQTPFTNITMDLKVPASLKNEPVVIGGEKKDKTYGDFQKEMDMLNNAFAEVMMEGDAKGRIFTFPIPTYNITKDFDWEDTNLDKVWLMTAKYGIPYFSNFVNTDMNPDDARSMCCRLRLDNRELRKRENLLKLKFGKEQDEKREDEINRAKVRGGGLFGANPLTGSVGVVTINVPRIAFKSKSKEEYFKNLEKIMDIAKDSLEIKRKVLENFTNMGLYPYARFYLRNIKEKFGSYWANHFSTIGLVGMNEASLNLIGKDIATEEGQKFAVETLQFMRERLGKYQDETGNLYNLEASPAEGTSYRLAKIDKEKFPDIITQGTDAPFYTNSTQLPVDFKGDVFEALKLQDNLQTQYTGGTVFHIFLGESINDIDSCKNLVKKVAYTFKLPYYTITPTFSICPVHGYIPGEYQFCPYEHTEEELKKYGIEIEISE